MNELDKKNYATIRCTIWNTTDIIKADHFYTITACILEKNQGLCISDAAETNYVVGQYASITIDNFYDITTESINGRRFHL